VTPQPVLSVNQVMEPWHLELLVLNVETKLLEWKPVIPLVQLQLPVLMGMVLFHQTVLNVQFQLALIVVLVMYALVVKLDIV